MYFSFIVPVREMIVKAVRRKYPVNVSDATKSILVPFSLLFAIIEKKICLQHHSILFSIHH